MSDQQHIDILLEALRPFAEAYALGAVSCANRNLGEWGAMAKHHTSAAAFKRAAEVVAAFPPKST